MIKKSVLIFCMATISLPIIPQSFVIIWDLGGTLVEVETLGMVLEIGLADCIWYHLFQTKEKNQLQNLMFDVLEEVGGKQSGPREEQSYHTAHRPLPQIMCDWLSGKILDTKKLIKTIHAKMRQLYGEGYFKSRLEYRVVKAALTAMFKPEILIKNTKIMREALKIVQEIASKGVHQQTILSNWDAVSYNTFKESHTGRELSRYFDLENIIISGSLNLLKPQFLIFEKCLNRYGVAPENCIFIDDQEENITAALSYGFNAIQLKNYDFKQLRKDLISWGVL